MNKLVFQALEWTSFHQEDDEGNKYFNIRIFGRTLDDKTVYVHVKKYTPYFYIKIPNTWRKHYTKLLIDEIKTKVYPSENANGLKQFGVTEKCDFYGFTNYSKFKFIQLVFNDHESMRSYSNLFNKKIMVRTISNKPMKFKTYEASAEPMLRMMHIRDVNPVGFIQIDQEKYKVIPGNPTCCDINISTDWTNLEKMDMDTIGKLKILSFDIECTSPDGTFPQAEREDNQIIQIGSTLSRYGESECYKNYMYMLGNHDKNVMKGVETVSYDDERDVLLAWRDLIRREDPDIITGYNVVGFDFQYMKDRALKLGIYKEFSKLSRMTDEDTPFLVNKLSSSALGDNIYKYYDMTGRVIIDMMKVAQRDYKLNSYTLDNVTANFIKEKISSIEKHDETTLINTKSTYGIKVDDYVTITYNDGSVDDKHMNGAKFKILEINENKSIVVDGVIDDDVFKMKYKVFWCQAKDDMPPKNITIYHNKSDYHRSLVAKYCIMDCALCNKLIAKLQVITNNISMAKVCHVPFSYLFFRGQGIKIYSLVLRKCRMMNHLIPTLKKKKMDKNKTEKEKKLEKKEKEEHAFENFINMLEKQAVGQDGDEDGVCNGEEDDDDDDGYEGATVFTPKKGVYFEPIAVLDYGSLYPSSMIFRNLSHETFVDNPKYDNLPGYIYHDITYLSSKIIDKLKMNESIKRKVDLLAYYDELKYPHVSFNKTIDGELNKITQVFTSDEDDKKLVAEIVITKKEFRLFRYESARFAEKQDGSKGIIPEILRELLSTRKHYKKLMENESDPFIKEIYNCTQLAYKVTANSLYGQTGSSVSPIYMRAIAASTTATGREMLQFAKHTVEKPYNKLIKLALSGEENKPVFMEEITKLYEYFPTKIKTKEHGIIHVHSVEKVPIPDDQFKKFGGRQQYFEQFYETINKTLVGYNVSPEIIYGDTDSVFFNCHIKDNKTGKKQKDKKALETAITIGVWASHCACLLLMSPQKLEYEKTLWPFAILTKKRYVGNLYEEDPNSYYQKCMGIVLKRRDNALIVKIVCGGVIDQMLNKQSPEGAVNFVKKKLVEILSGKYPIDKFVITKTLRENYADRSTIVHAVLADRIGERDPGNKPLSNDRIPYAYVELDYEPKLQGDRVEDPKYIIENNLKLDYLFYITNQIMIPVVQFLELIVENPEKIFKSYIVREENRRKGIKPIHYYINKVNTEDLKNQCENTINNDDDVFGDVEVIKKPKKKIKKKVSEIGNISDEDSVEIVKIPKKKSKPAKKKKDIGEISDDEDFMTNF